MSARVALCADESALSMPGLLGLEGECLDDAGWLSLYAHGEDARCGIGADADVREVWVFSCDDVEPINLAAALKGDRPDLRVSMVSFDADGSLLSRAHTAQVDEVLDRPGFVRAYARAKHDAQGARALALAQPAAVRAPSPAHAGNAFLMPVVSGSGGAGKSTVSVLSALVAAKAGYSTLLVDCDFQFGDVACFLGMDRATSIEQVAAHPDLIDGLAESGGLSVIAPPARLEDAERVVHELPAVIDAALERFQVVVANTGAGWGEAHAVLLERSTAALFLVDQRASSLRACRHALELCGRCGIATGPFQFALNRCAKGAPLSTIDASCALQGRPVFELRDGGREVEEFLGGGYAADLLGEGNDLCSSVAGMLARLLPDGERRLGADVERAERRRAAKRRPLLAGRRKGERQ